LAGGIYVSNQITGNILDKIIGTPDAPKQSALSPLSDRELEVLMLIGKGNGSAQIAKQLHISVKTVEAHRANIKYKLHLDSSTELLQYAIRWSREMGEI
jgi:DNA-binding NarL/FixJ family response regulator